MAGIGWKIQDKAEKKLESEDSDIQLTPEKVTLKVQCYVVNKSLKFRCPWCGNCFTSCIRRQIHLLFYPRIVFSCNDSADAFVRCIMCEETILGKYFDIHPCMYDLVKGLGEMQIRLSDDVIKTEAPDFCVICRKFLGCRFTLMSHILVQHFPFADENQCGYCGKPVTNPANHVKIHRMEIILYSTQKMVELIQNSVQASKKKKEVKLFSCCDPQPENMCKPQDVLLYFTQPNSCLLCINFMGNQLELQSHILWDWMESNHRTLRNVSEDHYLVNDKFICRYCNCMQDTMDPHTCFDYIELFYPNPPKVPKTEFNVKRNCLICWNRTLTPTELLAHIPTVHNISAAGKCGICYLRIDQKHFRSHELLLSRRAAKDKN